MSTTVNVINGTLIMNVIQVSVNVQYTDGPQPTGQGKPPEKSKPEPPTVERIRKEYGFDIACMVEHFNSLLKGNQLAAPCIPLTDVGIFLRTYEGILLCALANLIKPNSVDEKTVVMKPEQLDDTPQGEIVKKENRNIGITALRAMGITLSNQAANNIKIYIPGTMLGLLVQLLRLVTIGQMHFQNFELLVHLFDGWSSAQEASSILATDREKMLIIWVNHQLKKARTDLQLMDFDAKLSDSKVYSILIWTVAPEDKRGSLTTSDDIMKQTDLTKRAELVIANAEKLGIVGILRPEHIVKIGKLSKINDKGLLNIVLNMAFVFRIFHAYPNIDVPKMAARPAAAAAKKAAAVTPQQQIKDSCKYGATEDTLIRWLNSFGPSSPVMSLKTDLCNGQVLLEVWDAMFPGCVNWKQVKLDKLDTFAKRKFNWMANCDIAINIGEKHGIKRNVCSSGNISAGETKFIASLVFLMMRLHAQLIRKEIIGGSKVAELDDNGLVKWFNEKMEKFGDTFRLKGLEDILLKKTSALGFFGERVLAENNLCSSGPADFPRKPADGGASAGTKTAVGKPTPPPVAPKPKMPTKMAPKSGNAVDNSIEGAAEENANETTAQDEEQQQADANNSAGGAWLFSSVEQVASDPAQLTKFSVTAILMFSKAGVIVYASRLGPETDTAVYRSVLMELNAFSLKST